MHMKYVGRRCQLMGTGQTGKQTKYRHPCPNIITNYGVFYYLHNHLKRSIFAVKREIPYYIIRKNIL
jgi:hypothetical protein